MLNSLFVKLWYIWIVILSIISLSIFSAINFNKMKNNRVDECMNLYYEYEEIIQKQRTAKPEEKDKSLKEYLEKLRKLYTSYKDLECSDYLLLRQAQILEEQKQKEEAMKIYQQLQDSKYNCMPKSQGCTIASEIASLIITRTNQNKEIWEKEILKNILKANDPELVIVMNNLTLSVKLKYSLFPDNVGFLINSIRKDSIKKVKVESVDDKFIDLKLEGQLQIPQDSYIQREKGEPKELDGKRNFVFFKVEWNKNNKLLNSDYYSIRICKKCEFADVEQYSVIGELTTDINDLQNLKIADESLSVFLKDAQVQVPMPNFIKKE